MRDQRLHSLLSPLRVQALQVPGRVLEVLAEKTLRERLAGAGDGAGKLVRCRISFDGLIRSSRGFQGRSTGSGLIPNSR